MIDPELWKKLSNEAIKKAKQEDRHANRFQIYSCAISTLALLVSVFAVIISLVK